MSRRRIWCLPALFVPLPVMSEPSYRRESKVNLRGVSKESSIAVPPRALVEAFGPPTDESWDSESLGGFYFLSPEQIPFTVYYRAYDQSPASVRKLRQSFWLESSPAEFSIGALSSSGVPEFKAWLRSRLEK
jgi:hypothetical protein